MTTSLFELVISDREFSTVQKLIYDLAGIVLSDSKRIMVQGRLNKRLRALEMESYGDYIDYLLDPRHADETPLFINALTTNKTDFFRERHHFDFLANTAFPEFVRRSKQGRAQRLRIWCSASSTGEEPYSIAIAIREFFGLDSPWDIRVLASDIDTAVLDAAKKGVYAEDRLMDMPRPIVLKYFDRESRTSTDWIAKSSLRDLITFRRINLQEASWPIQTSFDIIFCRNVMIYFDGESQRKIIRHFSDYLDPDGYLILGHSESLIGISDQFKLLGETVYHKTEEAKRSTRANRVSSPPQPVAESPRKKTAAPQQPVGEKAVPEKPIIVGEVHVSSEPMWITTVLGSCAAVCIFDPQARIGGMNHFMLPELASPSERSHCFGKANMERLLQSMLDAGADRRRLQAKVFGGSHINSDSHDLKIGTPGSSPPGADIGQSNVDYALSFLERHKIPVVKTFTGQDRGMQVRFHTHTAQVLVHLL